VPAGNDNTAQLLTPVEFAQLVAEFGSATAALHEEPKDRDRLVECEAARMKLIESYEGAYRGRQLRPA
jgi:hypothetical protein